MLELTEKYLKDHTNPKMKLELVGTTKLFLPNSNEKESSTKSVNECLNNLKNVLEYERVDRRCARIQAIWLNDKRLSKVTKFIGSQIQHLGYQNKDGKFLYPEETLFLLENNKLELSYNNRPISIEEAYNFILNETDCSLLKYRVYKNLVGQGYKLLKEIKNNSNKSTNKRKLEESSNENEEVKAKICKITEVPEEDEITKTFKRLRENAPKTYQKSTNVRNKPNYYGFFPTNFDKSQPDFNLYICQEQSGFDQLNINRSNSDIFAVSSDNVISFYQLSQVNIPNL